jgi:hypothetical protein
MAFRLTERLAWMRPHGPDPEAANVIPANGGALVRIGGDEAFYSPGTDHIQLPPEIAFRGPPEWAATALHELGHWTGHPSRLNRELGKRHGSAAYAMEELRAELALTFTSAELGTPTDISARQLYLRMVNATEGGQAGNFPRCSRCAAGRGCDFEFPSRLCGKASIRQATRSTIIPYAAPNPV